MEMTNWLVLWIALQHRENRSTQGLRLPDCERRGKDPIEEQKIILRLVANEATKQMTPVRHNPFVFRRPRIPDQGIKDDGFELNFSTYFNVRKPDRRVNVMRSRRNA